MPDLLARLIELLGRLLGRPGVSEPDPGPAPEPDPAGEVDPVIPPATVKPVTKDTPFRTIGDLPLQTWRQAVAGTPLEAELEAIVEAASPHGGLALPQALKESQYGMTAPTGTHNPLGLMDYSGASPVTWVRHHGIDLPFMVFARWADAFREFSRRLSDLGYKGGVYAPENLSLEGYLVTYVAGPDCLKTGGRVCANGETWRPGGGPNAGSVNRYIAQTIERINQFRPAGVPDPEPVEQSTGQRVAELALSLVGQPYDNPPLWRDCSSFTAYVWGQVTGVQISPDSHVQATLGSAVAWDELLPGDLLFFDTQEGREVRHGNAASHVGIWTRQGMVSAMNHQIGVRVDDPFGAYFTPKRLVARRLAQQDPRAGLVRHEAPGAPDGLWLPPHIEYRVVLTPVGPNRPGKPMRPQGVVQHETGNRGIGADEEMHSRWQDGGTQGHPDGYVGVHLYTADNRVVQKIPFNETSIHSGDSRNQTHISHELCVHADRNAELSEATAAAVDAALLRDVVRAYQQ